MSAPQISELSVGDALPELCLDITPKLIVGGAIASRDFQDVHHDKARAQELGSPDIFMNILTSNGLLGRYVTDWAGPAARLQKVSLRLGAPNYPGERMTMSGEITAIDPAQSRLEIAVRGRNALGEHISAAVTVALPPQ